tara:strand:- start:328 stop:1641 length:1314 start_codon:yes stop_codon:yes gene_type:complete
MKSSLLFLQLNEINFDIVDEYLANSKKNKFLNLKYIKNNFNFFHTFAEEKYENLEPWIQWASVNLGETFNEHKIFRLGDIVSNSSKKQIFEIIENRGYKVGAICPMNAANRLTNPSYFIPDPWTETFSDNSKFSNKLSAMLKQSVNDNASGKLTLNSKFTIIETLIKTLDLQNTYFIIKLIFSSIKNPWKKSLVLDYLIHMVHMKFLIKKFSNFSSIFFNAGAHIQHHYLFNSKHINQTPKNPKWYVKPNSDPIEDMLEVYDRIIGNYLKKFNKGNKLIISTGLRQVPYKMVTFYYRLKDHSSFLKKIGINFLKVSPRMTRDFEIIFNNENDQKNAKKILQDIKCIKNNFCIFGEIEDRKKSLFVTLNYPNEVKKDDYLKINNDLKLNFLNEIVFVAIKNGMHDSKGYVFYSPNSNFKKPSESIHVSKLHDMILSYF